MKKEKETVSKDLPTGKSAQELSKNTFTPHQKGTYIYLSEGCNIKI
jgi:hypothetical protein